MSGNVEPGLIVHSLNTAHTPPPPSVGQVTNQRKPLEPRDHSRVVRKALTSHHIKSLVIGVQDRSGP